MAVRYKIKKFVNSTSSKNGFYYGRSVMLGELDLDGVADKIQQNCSMKRSDVKAVLTELVEVMTEALQDSKKVRIDGFGSFTMGMRSELVPRVQDFSSASIKGFRVNFRPEYTIDPSGQRTVRLVSGAKAAAYVEHTKGVNDNE